MKIIQLISIKFEMKNIGIIVYGRFPTEKAYGSHIIDIADGFLENNCNVNVFYSKTSNKKTLDVSPQEYYENNLGSLINVIKEIEKKENDFPFIFSSSCTVYGQADKLPIDELAPIKKAESPYGKTKQFGEEIF